jgi:SAM-dependent methyltransferase
MPHAADPDAARDPTRDPKARFSDRVDAYVRHRPGYPDEVVRFFERTGLLRPGMTVADIGSGTGISAALFRRHGYSVVGVEPNDAMRRAAEQALAGDPAGRPAGAALPAFRSVAGSAEATTLPDKSVDFVAAGQAFHWFDRPAARREFARILQTAASGVLGTAGADGSTGAPGGGAGLFWNSRELTGSAFAEGYEELLVRHATDYATVRHDAVSRAAIDAFFAPAAVEAAEFPSEQRFDYGGLEGRLLSSSYAPAAGAPGHAKMVAALRALFDRCQVGGTVLMAYRTEVYAGRIAA